MKISVTTEGSDPRWDDAETITYPSLTAAIDATAQQLREETEGTDWGDDAEEQARWDLIQRIDDLATNTFADLRAGRTKSRRLEAGDPSYNPIVVIFRAVKLSEGDACPGCGKAKLMASADGRALVACDTCGDEFNAVTGAVV